MERADIYQEQFSKKNFTVNKLPSGDYEKCEFFNCDFSGSDLSKIFFIDCDFSDCNFSNVKLLDTAFRNITFTRCKMLGLHFEDCNKFLLEMSFHECTLNHSSFYQIKLSKGIFNNCILQEVDFTEAQIPGSSFLQADLFGAIFNQTNLEQADFRNALHFSINPANNNLEKARFSADGLAGLLTAYQIIID